MAQKIEIRITGMSCEHCVKRVKEALSRIEGVKEVSVELVSGKGYIVSEKEITINIIKEALKKEGYGVKE
ncbi:MAG: copper-binding protein [Thermodesulfobacterium geofontis]|uniref:Copper-binding protein n=1 Tax=Thermodesulfobacterium geofontis TaxID=1295609 RepID=A0A2N7PN92_9BACT|nr:MAG: copper-binding protein [Thermodesulfobacterium geofontis]PMP97499.1 MAG: copper-binding protein [Thermodesulfobacterium geofontis]HEM55702.1 heavy-metal-associated domain-containing protein [Thermodesulfobium narugense]